MRIHFSDSGILVKNAKRTVEVIRELEVRDPRYNTALPKINLTKIKDALAKAYGYTNGVDLNSHLSSSTPQLKDLNNQQRMYLEQSIMVNLGEYLMKCGMTSNMAYSIAFSIAAYLDEKLVKKKKVKRPGEYATYKKLSAKYGMTIPVFKDSLVGVKSLNGEFPSKKALEKGWCVVTVMMNSYGIKPKILWNSEYIHRSFSTQGIKVPIDFQKYKNPRNLHGAETIFGRLEEGLVSIIEGTENNPSAGDQWGPTTPIYVRIHPVAHFAVMNQGGPENRRHYLYSLFEDLLLEAREINPDKTKLIELSLEKLINRVSYY